MIQRWARAALQARQRQQVTDQSLHAARLLIHQHQHTFAFGFGQRQRRHGFDETGQHCQRRANFMRHVGNKIPPHRLVAFAFGDVLRQQQALAFTETPQRHQHRALATRTRQGHDRIRVVRRLMQGLDEGRHAHEVGDALTQVTLRIQPQVIGCDHAAPLDLLVLIQQQHTVGRGFNGLQEMAEARLLAPGVGLALAQQPLDPHPHVTPQPGLQWRMRVRCQIEPAIQTHAAPRIPRHPRPRSQHAPYQAALPVQGPHVSQCRARCREASDPRHRRQDARHDPPHHPLPWRCRLRTQVAEAAAGSSVKR